LAGTVRTDPAYAVQLSCTDAARSAPEAIKASAIDVRFETVRDEVTTSSGLADSVLTDSRLAVWPLSTSAFVRAKSALATAVHINFVPIVNSVQTGWVGLLADGGVPGGVAHHVIQPAVHIERRIVTVAGV
jgi:hypothetical protein